MKTIVRFRTGDGEFGVLVDDAREVRTTTGMRPVPSPSPGVVGFLPSGGEPLTVIAALGGGADQVLVLDAHGQRFGLLVESVVGVLSVDDAQIGPPPAGQAGPVITGVLRVSDTLVLLVDAVALARTLAG